MDVSPVTEQSFKIRFSEIETAVPSAPGLYEIVTDEGKLLKVGIRWSSCGCCST